MRRFLPVVVSMAMVWVGCGGSKSSSTTTTTVSVTISPTTASVAGGATQQFTATVTGSTNTAVTWQVNGATGGDAISGTISTTGLYTAPTNLPTTTTVSVGAISQASASAVANATVTLTAPAITITLSPTSPPPVAAGATLQFTATVTGGTTNKVTWSIVGCSGNPACGAIDQTGLYMAPASPPKESITVTATSQDNTSFSASAPVTLQFGNASLNGNYVFLATQPDNSSGSGFAFRGGTFVADGKGNITGGTEDSNSSAGGVSTNVSVSGTYSVGADGRGRATITDTASHTFSFALTSSTRGQLIGFDSGVGSGLIRQQDQTAIAGVSGPFVFSLAGDTGGPSAAVGEITFTGNTITGNEDASTAGAVTQGTGLMGSFSVPAGSGGRGTATINSSNFAFYIIDASTLALIDIDGAGARMAGTAYAQAASPFNTASLGSSTYFVSGNAVPGSNPYAQAGRFDTDGTSKLNGGLFDANNAGTLTTNAAFSSSSSYTLSSAVPTNGRGTISTGTSTFIFWLASPKQGVIMESDSTVVATGLLFQRQTGISSVTGGYEFVVAGASADGTTAQAIDGELTVAGLGVVSGTEDSNSGGNVQSAAAMSGSLALAQNERGTGTIKGTVLANGTSTAVSFVPYLITADRFIMLSASSTSVLSGMGERQCSDCGF